MRSLQPARTGQRHLGFLKCLNEHFGPPLRAPCRAPWEPIQGGPKGRRSTNLVGVSLTCFNTRVSHCDPQVARPQLLHGPPQEGGLRRTLDQLRFRKTSGYAALSESCRPALRPRTGPRAGSRGHSTTSSKTLRPSREEPLSHHCRAPLEIGDNEKPLNDWLSDFINARPTPPTFRMSSTSSSRSASSCPRQLMLFMGITRS